MTATLTLPRRGTLAARMLAAADETERSWVVAIDRERRYGDEERAVRWERQLDGIRAVQAAIRAECAPTVEEV